MQKLSKNAGLSHGGNNLREHSMWEIIGNTVDRGRTDLVLILDEAHKGMKRVSDRKTIVRQIIDGRPDSNPPIPVVWGISATIERFKQADEGPNRAGYLRTRRGRHSPGPSVGLLKDEIGLDDPDESGTFSTTLLHEAVKDTLEFERRWAAYSANGGGAGSASCARRAGT